ncbi:MAG: UDP-N-acetylmuramate dehydrogenase [Muribaculaceae bacterium]|nr:UDP-N-acetylmuramate dehydrogenase [Muribaculaceae bacterium]
MKVEYDVEAGALATFGVRARAAAVVRWTTADDLRRLPEDLPRPLKVIGGGSNLLFTGDFGGTLLVREGAGRIERESELIWRADGNVELDALCAALAEAGVRGLENLSGIPGTVGGALVQNAGAYGSETCSHLLDLRLLELESGRELTVDRQWLAPDYRTSRLQSEPGYVVLSATFKAEPATSPANVDYGPLRSLSPHESPMTIREAVLATRASKLPDVKQTGSAGSFFRNPEVPAELLRPEMPRYELANGLFKVPAAWLIDQCGLKGQRRGGAMVWPDQPLVIVNAEGTATAADILELEQLIVNTVHERFNITLTPEVEHI